MKSIGLNKFFNVSLSLAIAVLFVFSGCGSGGGGSSTGHFIDSAVGGLEYTSDSTNGITGSDGSFNYIGKESITFKVGGATIGTLIQVPSDGKVLPQDVVGVSRNSLANLNVLNIARFLQTLDSDGDPTNGITITSATRSKVTSTIDVSTASESTLSNVATTVGAVLKTASEAQSHLTSTFDSLPAISQSIDITSEVAAATSQATNPSISGRIVDDYVSGATMTGYDCSSEIKMTSDNQIASGTTTSSGEFDVTLTVSTIPDYVCLKTTGGTMIDTGLPAPDMAYIGSSEGPFNLSPITNAAFKYVFKNKNSGNVVAAAINSGKNEVIAKLGITAAQIKADPLDSANAAVKTAMYKTMASTSMDIKISAGDYKIYLQSFDSNSTLSDLATIVSDTDSLEDHVKYTNITVDSAGAITGDAFNFDGTNSSTVSGSIYGKTIILFLTQSNGNILYKFVGQVGSLGAISGYEMTMLNIQEALAPGLFIGKLVPAGLTAEQQTKIGELAGELYTGSHFISAYDVLTDITNIGIDALGPTAHYGTISFTGISGENLGFSDFNLTDINNTIGCGNLCEGCIEQLATNETNSSANIDSYIDDKQNFGYISLPNRIGGKYILNFAVGSKTGLLLDTNSTGGIVSIGQVSLIKKDGLANSVSGGSTYASSSVMIPWQPNPASDGNMTKGTSLTDYANSNFFSLGDIDLTNITNQVLSSGICMKVPVGADEGTQLMTMLGTSIIVKVDTNDTDGNGGVADGNYTSSFGDQVMGFNFGDGGTIHGNSAMALGIDATTGVPGTYGPSNLYNFPFVSAGFMRKDLSSDTFLPPDFKGDVQIVANIMFGGEYIYEAYQNEYYVGTINVDTTSATNSATIKKTISGSDMSATFDVAQISNANITASNKNSGLIKFTGTVGSEIFDIVWPVGSTKGMIFISPSSNTAVISKVGEVYFSW